MNSLVKPMHDRDTGPIRRFEMDRDGAAIDLSNAAFEVYTFDESGVQIGRRPARVVAPKASSGLVDLTFESFDTDRDGAGGAVYIKARGYYAVTNDGSAAAGNLLVNPSFDTGTTVATSWTQAGTLGGMIYEIRADDPWPPVIFGSTQRSLSPAGGGSTAYIRQDPATTIVPGDFVSGGVWYRSYAAAGANIAGAEHYLEIMSSRAEQVQTSLVAATDWRFVTIESRALNGYASLPFELVNFDLRGYEVRYDDAFLFVGRWRVVHSQPIRIPIEPRAVPLRKAVSTLVCVTGGYGGFEYDSNGDGVADGVAKSGSTNTYAHETDPDHVNTGYNPNGVGSQKVTLASATADRLRLIAHVKVLAGESWTARLNYKNTGVLAGSPAAGQFGLVLHSDEFDGTYEESSTVGANFSQSSISFWATKSVTKVFAESHNRIVVDINLNGVSGGSIWLDDLEVFQN